jgi:hypothetical protein
MTLGETMAVLGSGSRAFDSISLTDVHLVTKRK